MQIQDYHDVAKVIDILEGWEQGGRTLGDASLEQHLAARLGWSRDDLQSLFIRWAGGDLGRFLGTLGALGVSHTRKRLLETRELPVDWYQPETLPADSPQLAEGGHRVSVLLTDRDKGSGKGAKAPGLILQYGIYASPFGECFLARSGQEICALSFVDKGEWQSHRDALLRGWPQATIIADDGESGRQMVPRIFTLNDEEDCHPPLRLLLQGTSFQFQVWRALLMLPRGALISYQDLAVALGRPAACRAVAGAVAANPIAYLIPCHRVIRKSGEIHQYRWGRIRKKIMLAWEACRS